jgi:hypothetical protein
MDKSNPGYGLSSSNRSSRSLSEEGAKGEGQRDRPGTLVVHPTEQSFLIRPNTRQTLRKYAPLISNSSHEDSRYFANIRRRLTSNDGCKIQGKCAVARVRHALPDVAMLFWLDV